jgi:biopolymer transport protein ExbB/TolQ
MFTAISLFLKNPSLWKFAAILAILLAVAGVSAAFTYSHTKTFYVSQGDSRVLKVEQDLNSTKDAFEAYKTEQAARVRDLELASSAQAASAASSSAAYQNELKKKGQTYVTNLAKRKESAGSISSSAVDLLNDKVTP